jgi:hypothetical protein
MSFGPPHKILAMRWIFWIQNSGPWTPRPSQLPQAQWLESFRICTSQHRERKNIIRRFFVMYVCESRQPCTLPRSVAGEHSDTRRNIAATETPFTEHPLPQSINHGMS